MHVRSNRQDKFSSLLYLLLVQFLSANQVFILHCFTGSFEISKAWLTQFPNTYFAFTFLASSFAQTQINALKSVPKDRLLVEADAPYIAPNGIRVNSPCTLAKSLKWWPDIDTTAWKMCVTRTASMPLLSLDSKEHCVLS